MDRYAVRPGSPDDFGRLADLMAEAVRRVGPDRYTPEQVEAWAQAARDDERFARLVQEAFTLVVEDGGTLVGFGAVRDNGHLTALYVHPDHGRRGIGSTILAVLLAHAQARGIQRVHAEASDFSHAVFVRAGFHVDAIETVQRNGVALERRLMSRSLP